MKRILVPLTNLLSLTMAVGAEVSSPRIERLRSAVADDKSAIAQFWQEVQAAGTPLIERAPDGDADVLVTFLWRGNANLPHVVVFMSVLPENDSVRQRLIHLPGTDVWYRTYRFPRDLPILYELSPTGPDNLRRDPLNPRFVDGPMGGSAMIPPGVPNLHLAGSPPAQRGKLELMTFRSEQLGNERKIRVYLPADSSPAKSMTYWWSSMRRYTAVRYLWQRFSTALSPRVRSDRRWPF